MDLRQILAVVPAELDATVALRCAHPNHRGTAPISIDASLKSGGKEYAQLLHADVDSRPVCHGCWFSHVGGHAEAYANFLVREHGKRRGSVKLFTEQLEIPAVASARPASAPRPSAAKHTARPASAGPARPTVTPRPARPTANAPAARPAMPKAEAPVARPASVVPAKAATPRPERPAATTARPAKAPSARPAAAPRATVERPTLPESPAPAAIVTATARPASAGPARPTVTPRPARPTANAPAARPAMPKAEAPVARPASVVPAKAATPRPARPAAEPRTAVSHPFREGVKAVVRGVVERVQRAIPRWQPPVKPAPGPTASAPFVFRDGGYGNTDVVQNRPLAGLKGLMGEVVLPTAAEKAAAAEAEAYQTYLDGLRERAEREARMGDDFERRALEAGVVRVVSSVSVDEVKVGKKMGVYSALDISFSEPPERKRDSKGIAAKKRAKWWFSESVVKPGDVHGRVKWASASADGVEEHELPREVPGLWFQSPELQPWQVEAPAEPLPAELPADEWWRRYRGLKLGWLITRMLAYDTGAEDVPEDDKSEGAAQVFVEIGMKWLKEWAAEQAQARASQLTPIDEGATDDDVDAQADFHPAVTPEA